MWTIQNGGTILGANFKSLTQELSGPEELTFALPNTTTNRAFVATDQDIDLYYGTYPIFNGVLKRQKYSSTSITCTAYNEFLEQMKRRTITNTFVNVAANTIFGSVCGSAGVTAGSCPTTPLSLRFEDALCYDVGIFLAKILQKDFWVVGGTAHIATKGVQQSLTNYNVSEQTVDRSKNIDKVKVISYDTVGNYITGEAGAGSNIKIFREQSASGTATLGSLAAKYLADLNTDSQGATVTALPSEANLFNSGDTVVLNKPKMNLAGTEKIYKITKSPSKVTLEVDRLQPSVELTLDEIRSYDRLGIIDLGAFAVDVNTDTQGSLVTTNSNVSAAQATADGKNTVYYQDAEPVVGGTYKVNDIWFDSNDGYKMYKYAGGGTWSAAQFGTNAIANLAIVNAHIADATIESAKIVNLDAAKITTGTLSAVITTSGTIQTAISGNRVSISPNTLYPGLSLFGEAVWFFDSGGTIRGHMDATTYLHILSSQNLTLGAIGNTISLLPSNGDGGGTVMVTGKIKASGYQSSDGSDGWTGSIIAIDAGFNSHTITVKNGLITNYA